jgi:hypothetical protein
VPKTQDEIDEEGRRRREEKGEEELYTSNPFAIHPTIYEYKSI